MVIFGSYARRERGRERERERERWMHACMGLKEEVVRGVFGIGVRNVLSHREEERKSQ
jgi:hypothetical protein